MKTTGALASHLSFEEEAKQYIPLVLPPHWERIALTEEMGCIFESKNGIRVLISWDSFSDGKNWLHVSLSRRNRLPSWEDIKEVKHLFVGPKKKAIQVFPSEDEYVNCHPYVLHLWHCIDGDSLPDFRREDGLI
jgi:hypothetical protein